MIERAERYFSWLLLPSKIAWISFVAIHICEVTVPVDPFWLLVLTEFLVMGRLELLLEIASLLLLLDQLWSKSFHRLSSFMHTVEWYMTVSHWCISQVFAILQLIGSRSSIYHQAVFSLIINANVSRWPSEHFLRLHVLDLSWVGQIFNLAHWVLMLWSISDIADIVNDAVSGAPAKESVMLILSCFQKLPLIWHSGLAFWNFALLRTYSVWWIWEGDLTLLWTLLLSLFFDVEDVTVWIWRPLSSVNQHETCHGALRAF